MNPDAKRDKRYNIVMILSPTVKKRHQEKLPCRFISFDLLLIQRLTCQELVALQILVNRLVHNILGQCPVVIRI